jgi:hypothetical protein
MRWYWMVLGTLAVWRITHLLTSEDGPWDLVVRLRSTAGAGFWGRLLDCFHCLSLWISAPVALLLGADWVERGFLWLSLSAGAILVERIVSGRHEPGPPIQYVEDPEPEHVLLRPTKTTPTDEPNTPSA